MNILDKLKQRLAFTISNDTKIAFTFEDDSPETIYNFLLNIKKQLGLTLFTYDEQKQYIKRIKEANIKIICIYHRYLAFGDELDLKNEIHKQKGYDTYKYNNNTVYIFNSIKDRRTQ